MASSLQDLVSLFGGNINTSVTSPTYTAPQFNEVNALRKRQKELDQLAENPESDAGAQHTLRGIQSTLTRSGMAALGATKGRAATSGQAGFAGAYAGSAATIEGAKQQAYAQAASKLFGDLASKSRDQSLDLSKSILQSEQSAENLATQRAQLQQNAYIAAMQGKLTQQNTLSDYYSTTRGQDLNKESNDKEQTYKDTQAKYEKEKDDRDYKLKQDQYNYEKQQNEYNKKETQKEKSKQEVESAKEESIKQKQREVQYETLVQQLKKLQEANTVVGVSSDLRSDNQTTKATSSSGGTYHPSSKGADSKSNGTSSIYEYLKKLGKA